MSRDLSRLLRWRHAGFRRRRLPYLVEQWVAFPLARLTFPFRDPWTWYAFRAQLRAAERGQRVLAA